MNYLLFTLIRRYPLNRKQSHWA